MNKLLPAAALLATAFVPAAPAAADAPLTFVGAPKAAFLKSTNNGISSYTMTVVARFSKPLPESNARVVIGPTLSDRQPIGSVQGGASPHRIGVAARHCYTIEVGRPRPVSTPKAGVRWQLGVTQNGAIVDTATTTLRSFPKGGDFGPVEAKQLGCSTNSTASSSNASGLIGQRRTVRITSG